MSDVIRKTPYVSPDTIRAKLHMDQKLQEAHTSETAYHQHSNQTYNVSHMKNWGAEMLLETRKLKMDRPPLGDVHLSQRFSEYFNLKYDDNVNTYEQENAIMCVLKEHTLEDGKQLYIRFENVTQMILPRASSHSEKRIFPHVVWKTTTPPKMYISGSSDNSTSDLIAYSDDDKLGEVTYWFCTTSTSTLTGNNHVEFYHRNLLDEENCTDDAIQTLPIEVWGEGLPLVWITFENFNSLPKIILPNNIGWNQHPIFTFGTDGNNNHYIYPFMWGKDNYPEERIPENSDWQVRLRSRLPFEMGEGKEEINKNRYISQIEFVHCKNFDPYSAENHLGIIKIPLPTRNVRFKFVTSDEIGYPISKWNFDQWEFRKPVEGDWDYNGTSYVNEVYAYLPRGFVDTNNSINGSLKPYMQPFLKVIPNSSKPPIEYMWKRDSNTFGMHVDYTTDYSLNNVLKKNGTIFNLGDFDGLPSYYYHKLPRDTHRAHVELYGTKDVPNGSTNHAMDKRVAAVIVDAGIPQTEISEITTEMKSAIVYDFTKDSPTYYTKAENIITILNVKSDIGYSSRSEFGDITLNNYSACKPFIYHGNRLFSLGPIGYDPELEYGRVYYLSNDPIEYSNNAIDSLKKPLRTMARVCDIPTDTSQLISINGKAPTLVLDEDYHRTELSYQYDDFMKLWDSRTLVKNGNVVFFQETDPYYNIGKRYESKFDYIIITKFSEPIDGTTSVLPANTRIGITMDQIDDNTYTMFWTVKMVDLYEGNTHVCKIHLEMKDSSNKITYASVQRWYVDISDKQFWHIDGVYLSASIGAGNISQAYKIKNFKMSLYLIDELGYEAWETLGVDFNRNPLDYELTYQWLNTHYGIPQCLEYCMNNKLHLCREIEAELDQNVFNEDGYRWQIRTKGSGYVAGDVIQCYVGGKVCRGIITQTMQGGGVKKIEMSNPVDPEYYEVSFTNFKRSQIITPALIKKQYGSRGNGLQLNFSISDTQWAYSNIMDDPGYANMNRLMALQYDAYGNLWIVIPEVIRTNASAYIPNGDITITEDDDSVMYTVVWNKVYQLTGEHVDANAYNLYAMTDFYRRTLNAIMMKSLYERITSYIGNDKGVLYSTHIANHATILSLSQDYESEYDSLTDYLSESMFVNGLLHDDSYYVLKEGTENGEPVYHVNWYECSDIWGYMYDITPFPRNHKAIIKPGMNKSGRLLIQSGTKQGVDYYDKTITITCQPSVFIYETDASSYPIYQYYHHGMTQRISDHQFFFTDFDEYGYYHEDKSVYEIQENRVVLRYDVYKYNGDHVKKPSEEVILEQYLEQAYEAYKAAHPAWEDETDEDYIQRLTDGWTNKVQREWLYKVAGQKGIDILYSPSVNDVNQSITLLRAKGEIVGTNYDNDTNTYEPIGVQPTGLSIPLTTRVYQKQYHWNTSPNTIVETDLQFFFKIPDDVESLEGFRLKHDDGNDISKYAMLLYKNKLYVFDDRDVDDVKWIPIQRRIRN